MTAPDRPITNLLVPQRRAIALPALTLGRVIRTAAAGLAFDPFAAAPPDRSNRSASNAQITPRPIAILVAAPSLARQTARLSAFPIAPDRPAPSFNPAYVRSPLRDVPAARASDLT
ncbi:MAG TPA: hypothetical protein VED87_11365 [Methylocystis sp.]|nr:hypothetical protein [Methylocystis sp.]